MLISYTNDESKQLEDFFPALKSSKYKIVSTPTDEYNCHAFAMNVTDLRWDPLSSEYWPPNIPRIPTLDTFKQAYQTVGFVDCADESLEPGVTKIAIYGKSTWVEHTARQVSADTWISKLGPWFDIEHELRAIEGNSYGQVVAFMKKPA